MLEGRAACVCWEARATPLPCPWQRLMMLLAEVGPAVQPVPAFLQPMPSYRRDQANLQAFSAMVDVCVYGKMAGINPEPGSVTAC